MSVRIVARFLRPIFATLDFLKPLVDLLARCWIAYIFFKAGLVKLHSWNSTMLLFTHEYQVPFLSPYFAALIGTTAELVLPILLVLGLGGRLMIMIFFIYNLVAIISYPFLFTAEGMSGLNQHMNWALLLAMLMVHGPGKWSLDYWIRSRHGHYLLR